MQYWFESNVQRVQDKILFYFQTPNLLTVTTRHNLQVKEMLLVSGWPLFTTGKLCK